MRRDVLFVVKAAVGVIAAFYLGAMFNFFPFPGNDLIVREIGFCTLIVCVTLAICARMILRAVGRKKADNSDNSDTEAE